MDKYEITVNTFNKLADKYEAKYMDFDFYFDTYDTFCELVTITNAKIFEMGCGPGNISKYLLTKRPDYQIFGIDLAPKMVELARFNNPSAVFEVMDSRNITNVKDKFDAVICGFCTPYLSKSDVEVLISNARNMLNVGGVLHLSSMEDQDFRSGYQTSSAGDQVYIHYHQFEHFKKHLELNNFKIIEVQRKEFPVDSGEPTTDMFIYAEAI